jgi:hypothetical protein
MKISKDAAGKKGGDEGRGAFLHPLHITLHSRGLGDIVDYDIVLSYRPARLHRLAGRYDNPMPLASGQILKNSADICFMGRSKGNICDFFRY